MNQRGFATLEVIMMVVVIGILATIAVPRFTDVTTKANTAKIQSDLTTIDTAIQMYYMEKGSYATTIKALVDEKYLMDEPTPPTGEAFINGTATKISATSYALNDDKTRSTLDSKTSGEFSLKAKS
ncbi:MAG: hypothetical protein IKZ58_03325 [Selenomonadaceae bacterium]|nr:hypothetical protein [Selenomonadaceae bacterium]